MARYIDADLFLQDIKMRYCNNCARPNEIKCCACHIDDMLGEIEDAPTADVQEVCRCKECANGYNKTNIKVVCKIWRRVMLPEDYCSYGAKMRGDNK